MATKKFAIFYKNIVLSNSQERFVFVSVAKKLIHFFGAKYQFLTFQLKIEEYRYMILLWFRYSIMTYYVYRFSRPTSTRNRECDIYWYSIQIMVIWKGNFQNKYRYWYFWHVQNEFSLGMSKHQATFWLWKFFRTVN